MPPRDGAALRGVLARIDGRPYPAYRDLRGHWEVDDLVLHFDHVQGDPFAMPSRVRLELPTDLEAPEDPVGRVAAEDWLLRRLLAHLHDHAPPKRGSGRSGVIEILVPGQEIVARSALKLGAPGRVELRLGVGLPAAGRRILGREAAELLMGCSRGGKLFHSRIMRFH